MPVRARSSATNESVVKAFGGGALSGGVQMREANSSGGLFGGSKPATVRLLQHQSLVPKSLEPTTKPNN
ncbi:uncharacterized protein LOC111048323 isoform X2 [Nilaparvata lugens]|uniref:uncharacterized protein LOC111048323 isoform X2 n=1 Tax=Nilaparvata lugens TaxID=108931 RepID=UPI000B97E138|nr:uncharacterized protein LOC111048323 isoform X2 [Nilaparvata lugens]